MYVCIYVERCQHKATDVCNRYYRMNDCIVAFHCEQPSYWFGGGRNTPDADTGTDNVSINGEFFEESTRKSVAGVQLRNLRKVGTAVLALL